MYYQQFTHKFKNHEATIFMKSQNLNEKGYMPVKQKKSYRELINEDLLNWGKTSLFQIAKSIADALHPCCYKVSIKTGNHLISYEK